MINVPRARASMSAIRGDLVQMPKSQLDELLAEVEVGQHARRALTGLRSAVAIAASTAGAAA